MNKKYLPIGSIVKLKNKDVLIMVTGYYSVEYEDIMAIIEEAIASLEKRNMKNLFMTVLDNKYEEAAMFMLQPEDFKNINIPD